MWINKIGENKNKTKYRNRKEREKEIGWNIRKGVTRGFKTYI